MNQCLFNLPPVLRAKPRKLMHVVETGEACSGASDERWSGQVRYGCKRCGHQTDWQTPHSLADAKRGVPCPACNQQ